MLDDNGRHLRWWGEFTIPIESLRYWKIGPLEIWFQRSEREWRIGTASGSDVADYGVAVDEAAPDPTAEVSWSRIGFREAPEAVELVPVLAARPLVVRPETAFVIPPKEEVTLFMSSPLWIRFELGTPRTQVLEEATMRPSDTWFGPSTREGELCYFSRTRARLHLEEIERQPYRAVSAFHIRNRAGSNLKLERLSLPVPHLSLFATTGNQLWTEAVTLDRKEDGDLAELQLGKRPPAELGEVVPIQGPREKPAKGLLIRAFGGLFS